MLIINDFQADGRGWPLLGRGWRFYLITPQFTILSFSLLGKSNSFCIFAEKMQVKKMKINRFGDRLRTLRADKNLLLRQVASLLETDTAHISKLERGERKAKREQVLKLATLFETNPDELITLWLSDRIYELVKEEKMAIQAIDIIKLELEQDKNQ
jgi:transcriptional regulator with XRE-family HTH domain